MRCGSDVKRSVANTAAASVDPTTAPSRSAPTQERSNSACAATATTAVVTRTPIVLRRNTDTATGRISRHSVVSPPSNRIAISASVPIVRASGALSNATPPIPSEPSTIPSPRKVISSGSRSRRDPIAATTASARTAPAGSR